jgi:5-methyltetrahydropteroyltriglutamate--homocysteine methyltransferase
MLLTTASSVKAAGSPTWSIVSTVSCACRFLGKYWKPPRQIESKLWLPDAPSKSRYDGNQTSEYAKAACVGPLRYKPEALQRDIANFKAAVEDVQVEEAFLPVVAPASVEVIFNKYYKTAEEYLFAVADALSTEYRMIVDAGFLLQIDDAMLPMMRFMAFGGRSVDEFHRWALVRIDALNHALRDIPEDRVRYHVGFGSQNVPHTFDPSLTDILDLILQIKAQAYSIEASNPRHEHEWQTWEGNKAARGQDSYPRRHQSRDERG